MAATWALGLIGIAVVVAPPSSAEWGVVALACTELVAVADLVLTIYADVLNKAALGDASGSLWRHRYLSAPRP